MNQVLVQKIAKHVAVTSALAKRAADELSVFRAQQEKAAGLRSEVLKLMVELGNVPEGQKQAAEAMLASHAETLGLLKTACEKMAHFKTALEKKAGDLGEGVDASLDSKPAYDSLNDPYVGRRTSEKKASDAAILKVLGR